MRPLILVAALGAVVMLGCQNGGGESGPPTAEEAHRFVEAAEARLQTLGNNASRAGWVQSNFITVDTQKIAADAQSELAAAVSELARGARRFETLQLPADDARKLTLVKLMLAAPAPDNKPERDELSSLSTSLEGDYGKGNYCRTVSGKTQCLDIDGASNILSASRDPKELADVWEGWHRVGAPMRDRYARFVELSNKGARELGFADAGVLWRSNYDMPPDAFAAEVDRLWMQVQPLYLSLHTYVRSKLAQKYGAAALPANGTLPAHLLGNMWAQDWSNIYPLVAAPASGDTYDLTQELKRRKIDERGIVKFAEGFFTSLGYQPLPAVFWERSLFTKPADRDVVCHASAWGWDSPEDVRIKMCIEVNAEDFQVVHHELGHNYYDLLYAKQPYLYRGGAIDAFHEAVGDLIALSATPGYLKQIGLIDQVPSEKADLEYLLKTALAKVAFLPFSVVIDQWRWKVFSGEVPPARYNAAWWELRNKYQGIDPPAPRTERDFDPGAKYHVPANTPYTRYFLAHILQFQFHRALCKEAGFTGPLYRCSIYGNTAAGAKLAKMLAMGSSRPWPDALAVLNGESKMDATAMLDYFAPLKTWLDEQNRNAKPGWSAVAQQPASARAIVSRADRIHTKPVTRREDGIPIGNGRMGTLVWTTARALKFQINRVDIEPIDLDLAGSGADVFTVDGTHQRLSVYEGLLDVKAAGVSARMLAWPERDVIAIEVDDRRAVPEPIRITLRAAAPLTTRDGRILLTQNLDEGANRAKSAVAIALLGRKTLTRLADETEARIVSPAERGRVVILIASAAALGAGQDVAARALGNLDAAAAKSFDDLAGDTAEWWHDFWGRSASASSSDKHHYDLYLNAASGSAGYP